MNKDMENVREGEIIIAYGEPTSPDCICPGLKAPITEVSRLIRRNHMTVVNSFSRGKEFDDAVRAESERFLRGELIVG